MELILIGLAAIIVGGFLLIACFAGVIRAGVIMSPVLGYLGYVIGVAPGDASAESRGKLYLCIGIAIPWVLRAIGKWIVEQRNPTVPEDQARLADMLERWHNLNEEAKLHIAHDEATRKELGY